MNRKKEQIQERREFGKASLYRRGRADSVIRLGSNLFAGEYFSACVSSSHLSYFIETPELKRHCFYKKSSGYFYFFPASGYRNYSSGNLGDSGTWGYGWTSTPNGSNAWNLNFNSGDANMNNNNRGNGFPVRCVQASAPVFVFTKDTLVFFPASGYRNFTDGKLAGSGANASGYGWTSTLNGNNAWSVVVWSGGARMDSYSRSDGFSVRCVQASAAVFAFANDTFVFFPATGYRDYSSGRVSDSGVGGYAWASTLADGSSTWRLVFHSTIAAMGTLTRTYGFSVRCVQASAAVWAARKKDIKQIRFRRESGKVRLYRRGQADSVTRLGRKLSASENYFVCAAPSYSIPLIKLPVFNCLYFYKHSSGYFLFFPASGYRTPDARLQDSGSEGDGWSLSPAGNGTFFYLRIISGSAYVRGANGAYGFPVRCVQASAAVFVYARKGIKETFGRFPASGYRNYDDGTLRVSGASGYGWTSASDGNGRGWYLDFWPTIARMYSNSCTYGFPVRCVQGSATVFVFNKETFLFFPAAGIRNNSDGSLLNSGVEGDGWTSVPDGNNAFRLIFKSGYAYVTSVNRTYGFPVRCVQASAAVWIASIEDTERIRFRREFGKARLCRRGQADSVTRLEHKLSAKRYLSLCAAPSHVSMLIRILILTELCFYKYSSGYSFFFPASGNRNNSDGKLYNSGTNGYGWTSTPNGSSNAYNLYFNSGDAYVNNNNRANGRSVRCVQASAAVFASGKDVNKRINADERVL